MNNMTFHANLIIQNDPDCSDDVTCLTSHVMNKIYHDYRGRAYSDQTKARTYILSQFLKAYIEEITDFENENSYHSPMTEELICGAIQEINFREIAETLIGDYSPKSPNEIAEYEEYFNIRGFSNYDIDED